MINTCSVADNSVLWPLLSIVVVIVVSFTTVFLLWRYNSRRPRSASGYDIELEEKDFERDEID